MSTKARYKPIKVPKSRPRPTSYSSKVGPVKNPVNQYDSLVNIGNKDFFAFMKAILGMIKF